MLLEFTTGRKLYFWSQESRKKGLAWDEEGGMSKEQVRCTATHGTSAQ